MVSHIGVVSGNNHFQRQRVLKQILSQQTDIQRVDGSEPGALSQVIMQLAWLTLTNTLIVVSNPHKAPLDLVADFNQDGVFILLHHEGMIRKKSKLDKFVQKLPKDRVFNFDVSSKPWELEEQSPKFVQLEARKLGVSISEQYAKALVRKVGVDQGVLYFELYKAFIYAKSLSLTSLDKAVPKTIADLDTLDVQVVWKALGQPNKPAKLYKALMKIRSAHRVDPTFTVCRLLGPTLVVWYAQSLLLKEGSTHEYISQKFGVNAWSFKKYRAKVLIAWGPDRLRKMVGSVAKSERAVLRGDINPWFGLVARLMSAVLDKV